MGEGGRGEEDGRRVNGVAHVLQFGHGVHLVGRERGVMGKEGIGVHMRAVHLVHFSGLLVGVLSTWFLWHLWRGGREGHRDEHRHIRDLSPLLRLLGSMGGVRGSEGGVRVLEHVRREEMGVSVRVLVLERMELLLNV